MADIPGADYWTDKLVSYCCVCIELAGVVAPVEERTCSGPWVGWCVAVWTGVRVSAESVNCTDMPDYGVGGKYVAPTALVAG